MLEDPVKSLEQFRKHLELLNTVPNFDSSLGGDDKYIIVIEPDQLPMIGQGVYMYNSVMNPQDGIDVSILFPPNTLFISPSGFAIKTLSYLKLGRKYDYIRELKDIPQIHKPLLELLGIKLNIQRK